MATFILPTGTAAPDGGCCDCVVMPSLVTLEWTFRNTADQGDVGPFVHTMQKLSSGCSYTPTGVWPMFLDVTIGDDRGFLCFDTAYLWLDDTGDCGSVWRGHFTAISIIEQDYLDEICDGFAYSSKTFETTSSILNNDYPVITAGTGMTLISIEVTP